MTTQNSRTLSSFSTSKLLSSTALAAASLAALALPANAQSIPDNALPQGEVVTHGSADYDRSTANVLKIKQNSGIVSADYHGGFNIGKNAAVLMDQKSSDKFIHIDKSDRVSIINGLFSGNGTNFILNRDGVLIGESATIDMGGFVASTGELGAGTDLAAGKIELNNFGGGAIDVQAGATISVAEAGIAAFVSPTIRNAGVINAKLGKVAFAAGDKVTLDLYGDNLVEIAVNDKLADAIIEHTGEINAEGGTVTMTAQAAKEAVDNIINVKGVVTVAKATQQGGKIILSGGEQGVVNVEGKLDASGATGGGKIDVTGEGVILAETSELTADGTHDGNGGDILAFGNRYAIMGGRASARGGANGGNGGKVELSATEAVGFSGSVDTSAANGETGTFLIDPKNINLGDFSLFEHTALVLADIIAGGNLDTIRIDDQALANTLRTTDVDLWATDKIYTSSDFDISTWQGIIFNGITENDLSLSAKTINIDHNITLGKGSLIIKDSKAGDSFLGLGLISAPSDITIETVNLNAQILAKTSTKGLATLAGASQIEGVADTVNVVSNKASINQGIQFAQSGKTVNVGKGTYAESVAIDRGLTIKGANVGRDASGVRLEETTVTGASPAFVVNANGVNIDGFTMSGKALTYGVQNNGGNDLVIQNNIISGGSESGIWANGGNNLNINHNKITKMGEDGIDVDNTTGTVSIAYNTIDGTAAGHENNGIEILGTTNAIIDNNKISNTGWNNINVAGATGLKITNNQLSSSAAASGIGIWSGSNNTFIDANTITGSQYGIWNQGGAIEIGRNTISGAAVDGIYLSNTASANIHNNFVSGVGRAGVYADGSTAGVTVFDNSFTTDAKNIINATANIVNASFNWWGSNNEATVAGKITGANLVDFSPYQGAGDDTDTLQVGYQGNTKSNLFVTDNGAQTTGIIQEAIDAANAGSTVTVNAGTYTENITINKALKLEGLTGATLRAKESGNLVTVTADDVNIDPITFDGFGLAAYGINATGADNLIIDGNTFLGFIEDSIHINDSNNVRVFGNTITGGKRGIYGNDTINIQGHTNTINGATVAGIHIENSNGTGYDGGGNDVDLWSNTIAGAAGSTGIRIDNSAYATVGWHPTNPFATAVTGGNIITGGAKGIVVNGSSNGYVAHNVVSGTNGNGIEATLSNGVQIVGNFVGYADNSPLTVGAVDNINGDGIRVQDSNNAVIKSNKVTQTNSSAFDIGSGIHIIGGSGVTVGGALLADGNTLTNIEWDGVKLTGGSAVTVQNNSLTNVERVGIYAGNVNGALITQNVLLNGNTALADYGVISSDGGSNLVITANDIDGSVAHGIRVFNAGGQNKINGNWIDTVSGNGIIVNNADGTAGLNLEIKDNLIGYGANKVLGTDDTKIGGNGILVVDSSYNTISGNKITGTALNGIYVDPSPFSKINFNTINGFGANASGILLEQGDDSQILGNTVTGNNGANQSGIKVTGSNRVQIGEGAGAVANRNTVANVGTGIAVEGGSSVTVDNNRITDAAVGISGSKVATLTITDNSLDGKTGAGPQGSIGISAQNVSGLTVGGLNDANFVDDFATGIAVASSNDAQIAYNQINNNGNTTNATVGIVIDGGDSVDVDFNSVDDAATGIRLNGTTFADVDDNILTDTTTGIFVNGASDADIRRNAVSGDSATGISVTSAVNTLEVLDNTLTVLGDGILFNDAVTSGDTVDIHGNKIIADSNGNNIGDGIRFASTITGATVRIGNGDGATLATNPSNIIDGYNGITFGGDVGTGTTLVIDGNRIGYWNGKTITESEVMNDGIVFAGDVVGNADVKIVDNFVNADNEGIQFDDISGTAKVLIGGAGDANTIIADVNGIQFDTVSGQSLVTISTNTVNAGNDGLVFGNVGNALNPAVNEQEILIADNTITGGNYGIRFAGTVSGERHDTRITGNSVTGQNEDAIRFDQSINDAEIRIVNNTKLLGDEDGISFGGLITNGALIEIVDNTSITGNDADGVDFESDINGGSVVRVNSNDAINGDDNGIEFAGVNGATVEIIGNNAGITADNHGIYFGGSINNGTLNIHDNIILADAEFGGFGNGFGDGIHFASTITNGSTVNIGNGSGQGGINFDASNIISGENGIYFGGAVNGNSDVEIDGNRLGYTAASVAGPIFNQRLDDNGIVFASSISGGADVLITDNFIRADENGVQFNGSISGTNTTVVVGRVDDGNTIDANDNGIEFNGSISGQSYITISHNDVDADDNGIAFYGETSNADTSFPYSQSEILISNNDVVGGLNGIAFFNDAFGFRHDITIRDNTRIIGQNGDGILFEDDIDAAALRIHNNDAIYGDRDGIHIEGRFTDGALIDIRGNSDVNSGYGDGIEVTDTGFSWGAILNIVDNHVHYTGDNGIEVSNVDGAYIFDNYVHDTNGDGIEVNNSDFADIIGNEVYDAGDDGIDVDNSDFADVNDNIIEGTTANGIELTSSDYADIEGNTVDYAGENGIYVNPSSFVDIIGNFVNFAGWDGIQVNGGTNNEASSNTVLGSGQNGIGFYGSDNFLIIGNTSNNNGEDGILVSGSSFGNVYGNTINLNLNDGIEVRHASNVDIGGNTALNNQVGVHLLGVDNVQVIGNGLGFNTQYGLLAEGGKKSGNGLIRLMSNIINASPVGARFESGQIDISSLGAPNIFVGTGGTVGMQFDEVGAPGSLSLVGDTIGATIFSGFLPVGSFYVRFEDGTLLDTVTGEPIVIDGLNANFDGLIPASQGGFVTPAQLAFLESRIFDADDFFVNGRGQLFVGRVPTEADLGLDNLEDFFNRYGTPLDPNSGFSVTVRGLPSVTAAGLNALTPAAGEAGPAGLNAIAPAAGEEDGAAATTAPQDIEPAAGDGENVSCWSDAVSAGGTTTFNFGGSMEDSIAGAGACNNGSI